MWEYFQNVEPDSTRFCGPYEPIGANSIYARIYSTEFNSDNHDTIGMIVIDSEGNIAAGTSTNGARYKIPGYYRLSTFDNSTMSILALTSIFNLDLTSI